MACSGVLDGLTRQSRNGQSDTFNMARGKHYYVYVVELSWDVFVVVKLKSRIHS